MNRGFPKGWRFHPAHQPPYGFGRVAAFVDGVYAIAATLLVLELRVPEDVGPGELGAELAALTPVYFAYAIGFLQMVGGWLQTRRLESWMRGVDHYATLLLVGSLGIYALTPFTTSVLAQALTDQENLGTAVRLTSTLLFIGGVLWSGILVYARRFSLFRVDVDSDAFRLYYRLGTVIWLVPPLAWPLTLVSPWLGLALLIGLFLLALLPVDAHTSSMETRMRRRGPATNAPVPAVSHEPG
jgi:uncharacterized membrane protein